MNNLAPWPRTARDHDVWGNLRTRYKVADRKKKSFGTSKNEEKAKKSKTSDGGGKKNGVQKYPENSKIYWSGAP